MSGLRRGFSWLHLLLAGLIVAGVWAQVYLIGAYVFGAGDGALDAHVNVGWSVHTAELALLLAALIARLPRPEVGMSLGLAVLGTVQVMLSGAERWAGALHPMFALAVLTLAAIVFQRAWRRVRAQDGAAASTPAAESLSRR